MAEPKTLQEKIDALVVGGWYESLLVVMQRIGVTGPLLEAAKKLPFSSQRLIKAVSGFDPEEEVCAGNVRKQGEAIMYVLADSAKSALGVPDELPSKEDVAGSLNRLCGLLGIGKAQGSDSPSDSDDEERREQMMSRVIVHFKDGSKKTLSEMKKEKEAEEKQKK